MSGRHEHKPHLTWLLIIYCRRLMLRKTLYSELLNLIMRNSFLHFKGEATYRKHMLHVRDRLNVVVVVSTRAALGPVDHAIPFI